MKNNQNKPDRRNGSVLMITMIMTITGTITIMAILGVALYKYREAEIQVCREQAFYVAQGGAERAATWVADGNEYDATLTGTIGNGSYEVTVDATSGEFGEITLDITSVGTVVSDMSGRPSVSRTITMRGVRRVSWSRYALWYDEEAMKLWITANEEFHGEVYAKPKFHFHDHGATPDRPGAIFYQHVATGARGYEVNSTSVKPDFKKGITYNAEEQTMATVNFSDLLATAQSGGLVLKGPTKIELVGPQMKVTNSEEGWNDELMNIPANGIVYVQDAEVETTTTTTSYKWVYNRHRRRWVKKAVTTTTTTTETVEGSLDISAPNGLDGRLTVVSDDDINIVDNIRYADNPRNNPNSDDALGMIAHDNIVVEPSAPNDVDIFAHMIAVNGGFGVKNYNKGNYRGFLNVYGGIVNKIRNAVGIIGRSGYAKHYMYDTRFRSFPPPQYPALEDILEWTEWDG